MQQYWNPAKALTDGFTAGHGTYNKASRVCGVKIL